MNFSKIKVNLKKIMDRTAASAISLCVDIFSRLDFAALSYFRPLGVIFGKIFPMRKKLLIDNLMLTKIASNAAEAEPIIKEMFVAQMQSIFEFFWMKNLTRTEELNKNFRIHGLHNISDAVRGVTGGVVASAHMGNWEMLSVALGKIGLKMTALIVERDLEIHRRVSVYRSCTGVRTTDRNHVARKCLRIIKNREIAGIVSDQHTDNAGIQTTFFGVPCMSTGLPAVLSLKTGAPIYCIFMIRARDLKSHDIYIEPPIYARDFSGPEGDHDLAVARCTQAINDIIEKYIRMAPEQWFWFHKRWRIEKEGNRISNGR